MRHNHLTRDIKPLGECPRCDSTHPLIISRDLRRLLLDVLTLHSAECTTCLAATRPCATRLLLMQAFV